MKGCDWVRREGADSSATAAPFAAVAAAVVVAAAAAAAIAAVAAADVAVGCKAPVQQQRLLRFRGGDGK